MYALSVPLCGLLAWLQQGQRAHSIHVHGEADSWHTGPPPSHPSLLPILILSALPFVIKEWNTFSLGLFVYWFPTLFGELGTKTQFVLSWPPALSLNTPRFSFSASSPLGLSILSAWMSTLHMLPFWMSSLVNNGLIYCVSRELSRIFFSPSQCHSGGLVCLWGRVKSGLKKRSEEKHGAAASVHTECSYMHVCAMMQMRKPPNELNSKFNKFSNS